MVWSDLSMKEIAYRLKLAPKTVNVHLQNIYGKTGTRGRVALALLVERGGLDFGNAPRMPDRVDMARIARGFLGC